MLLNWALLGMLFVQVCESVIKHLSHHYMLIEGRRHIPRLLPKGPPLVETLWQVLSIFMNACELLIF